MGVGTSSIPQEVYCHSLVLNSVVLPLNFIRDYHNRLLGVGVLHFCAKESVELKIFRKAVIFFIYCVLG